MYTNTHLQTCFKIRILLTELKRRCVVVESRVQQTQVQRLHPIFGDLPLVLQLHQLLSQRIDIVL